MKYNIIGDIHSRDNWKKLVREDCINIFVGDYFSPYFPYPFEIQMNNFMDIVMYKMKHPETIILIGNHDEDHWHIHERYSRFDPVHYNEIKQTFEENKDYLQVAYSIENKALVTHAGVSMLWYDRYLNKNLFGNIYDFNSDSPDELWNPYSNKMEPVHPVFKPSTASSPLEALNMFYDTYYKDWASPNKKPKPGQFIKWNNKIWQWCEDSEEFEEFSVTPDEIEKFVNNLWLSGRYGAFNFDNNASPNDSYGDTERHGPMWIRPEALIEANIFKFSNYFQFVGHSQFHHPSRVLEDHIEFVNEIPINEHEEDKIVWVDCLGWNTESIIYDPTTNSIEINKENKN